MVTWSLNALPFPKWEVSSPHPPSLPTKHWPVTIIIYFSNHLSSSLWWPLFSLVLKWPYAKYLGESERIRCWSSNYICMYVCMYLCTEFNIILFNSLSVQSNRSSILRRTITIQRMSMWRKARRRRKKRTWAHLQRRDQRRRAEDGLMESPGWRWDGSSGSHTGGRDRGVRRGRGWKAFASFCVSLIQNLSNQPRITVLCVPGWCLIFSVVSLHPPLFLSSQRSRWGSLSL